MNPRYRVWLALFLVTGLAACSSGPESVSSGDLKRVLQAHFDQQAAAEARIQFQGEDMRCRRLAQGPGTCSTEVVAELELLVKAGLLDSKEQSPGVSTYTITPEGKRYIRPLGIVGSFSSAGGSGDIIGYAVEEGVTVVTKIDSFTLPGTNKDGQTSTTVWFVIENRPYDWVKPYAGEQARTTHIGETETGRAQLVLTNKGWRVSNIELNRRPFQP